MKIDLIKEFNLPSYTKGKSFAQASKAIEDKFKDRTDKISNETKQELLERLSQAQEYLKTTTEASNNIEQNQAFLGGLFGNNQPQQNNFEEEGINPGLKQSWESTKDAVGTAIPIAGLFRMGEKAGKGLGQAIGGDEGGDFASGFLDPISTVMDKDTNAGEKVLSLLDPVVSGIINKNKNAKRKGEGFQKRDYYLNNQMRPSDYAFGGYTDPTDPTKKVIQRAATDNEIAGSTYQNSPDSMFNEYGLRALGASMNDTSYTQPSKLNLGKYQDVGYFNVITNPSGQHTINNTNKNPANYDLYKKQLENIQKLNPGANINRKTGFTPLINQKAMGGYQNKYDGITNPTGFLQNQEGLYVDADKLGLNAAGFEAYQKTNPIGTIEQPKTQAGEILSKTGDFLKNNYGDILRYAPLIGNLTNKIEKPVTDRPQAIQGTYIPQLFDEKRIINQVNENNLNKALSESSGGNMGALRSNLLASHLNKTKALGDAYAQASNVNRDEEKFKFESGQRKDMFNAQLNESYIDRKARDEGAYNTAKSAQRAAIFEDIGAIGKEESYKKIVKEMFGYKWNGKYFVDKEGKKVEQSTIDAKLKDKK